MTFTKGKSGGGHWPAGRRRNADNGDWETVRMGLTALLDEHRSPSVISQTALAGACGVAPKTVTRWMRGEDRPSIESQEVARAWLREKRDAIKRRAKKA